MLHHNKLPCHTPKLSRLWLAPELSRAPVSSQRALLKQQVSARRDAWRLDHWVDSSLQAHARQLSGRTDGFWPTNLHVMVWEACSACVRCVSSHERDRRLHAPRTHARTHVPSHCCGASQPSQGSTSPNHPRCGRLCCMRPPSMIGRALHEMTSGCSMARGTLCTRHKRVLVTGGDTALQICTTAIAL
jgi:hypothetical protein